MRLVLAGLADKGIRYAAATPCLLAAPLGGQLVAQSREPPVVCERKRQQVAVGHMGVAGLTKTIALENALQRKQSVVQRRPRSAPGQKRTYGRSENRRADDRFQSTAAVDRGALKPPFSKVGAGNFSALGLPCASPYQACVCDAAKFQPQAVQFVLRIKDHRHRRHSGMSMTHVLSLQTTWLFDSLT